MAKKTKQTRDCGESLEACAKVIEIGEKKIEAGEVIRFNGGQSFGKCRIWIGILLYSFYEVAKDLVKRG